MLQLQTLLAKTPEDLWNPRKEETLAGHAEFVGMAAKSILDMLPDWAVSVVPADRISELRLLTLLSAVLHDLGKTNNVFQAMLQPAKFSDRSLSRSSHPIRHELLSALVIVEPKLTLRRWLDELPRVREDFAWWVSWVVGGHHLKLRDPGNAPLHPFDLLVRTTNLPQEFIFYGSHEDANKIIALSATVADAPRAGALNDWNIPLEETDDRDAEHLESIVKLYVEKCEERSSELSEDDRNLLATAKAIVIAADVAASALSKDRKAVSQWIPDKLSRVVTSNDLENAIAGRLGKGYSLRGFQSRVADSNDDATVVIAGCGNGKTIAAYAWARRHANGRKLFFCYPTTGTASAGFEDYLLAQTKLERHLIHGRSHVDIERMLRTREDSLLEENQRLESLQAWSRQVIACTVDTVLGLIQNQRRGLFSYPALATAAFVFDEVHSYDAKLFAAMLRFFRAFSKSPVLLMSASIPDHRLSALKAELGDRMGSPINGDEAMEQLPRYKLEWRATEAGCWQTVSNALQRKTDSKVLWVCNTVRDAIALYETAIRELSEAHVLIYHSQFRYKDRVNIQEQVIKEFAYRRRKNGSALRRMITRPSLVIATQVCEMSLDISADLIVTALPPFTALIQRLGRLNRYAEPDSNGNAPPVGSCLIHDFSCQENRPYSLSELAACKRTIRSLLNKEISQHNLALTLRALPYTETDDDYHYSAWLDGGWETTQRPLREDGGSVTVLLEHDVGTIRKRLGKRRPTSQNLAEWTVPVSYPPDDRPDVWSGELLGPYPVISKTFLSYDEATGAQWAQHKP